MSVFLTLKRLGCVAALFVPLLGSAEDIDLYQGGAITGDPPNVLIILDNSANWSRASEWNSTDTEPTQGAAQIEAIKTALSALTGDVRVGIMMQSQSGNTSGGYVRYGLRNMSGGNKDALTQILGGIKPNVNDPSEKVAQSSYSGTMREAYQYFSNSNIYGPNDGKRDYTGNGAFNISPFTAGTVPGNPLSSSADTTYTGPLSTVNQCSKNFIIFIGNEWNTTTDTDSGLSGLPGAGDSDLSPSPIYSDLRGDDHYGDEWARYLKKKGAAVSSLCVNGVCPDGTVTTYTINVCYATCIERPQLGVEQEALLKSMAKVGGGRYFRATSTEQIKEALTAIFNEVQAKNSVFSSASLPVSVNAQGTYLNQVYIGVFRPDGGGAPRWVGNLKQFQFAEDPADGRLYLADASPTPIPVVDPDTGFVGENVRSFWSTAISPACTSDPAKGFWCFDPRGAGGDKDVPDGGLVEKGAAAQKLRAQGPSGRTMYTCNPCVADSVPPLFAASNTALTTALNSPVVSVSLARNGPVVTGTIAASLGLASTDSVTISEATQSAFNGYFPLVAVPDTTHFQFSIRETPATPATGAAITVSSGVSVTSNLAPGNLTFDVSNGRAIVTLPNHGFATGQLVNILGVTGAANDLVLNGNYIQITVLDANRFYYTPTLLLGFSEPQAMPTAVAATAYNCNGSAYGAASLWRSDPNQIIQVITANNSTNVANLCKVGNTLSLTLAGFNSSYQIVNCPGTFPTGYPTAVNNRTFCVQATVGGTVAPTSPALGTITVTGMPTKAVSSITRTDGNASNVATVTVTTMVPHGFGSATSVVIAGADQTEYNGTKTSTSNALAFPTTDTITYTLTTGPAASATGMVGKGYAIAGTTLVNWVRGVDNKEDENANNIATDVRASIHGDVLHSRPLIINYGGTTGIYAFYGANDGTLHAVKAGQAATDGSEAWAFVAPEHYSKLGRLYANTPLVKFPNTSLAITPTPTTRSYFFDGNIGVYQTADSDPSDNVRPDKTHIFVSMRRGGQAIYALDVSNPTVPKFLWKVPSTDTGFSQLGQTWSEPKVIPISTPGETCNIAEPSTYRLALVFGAGYDADQEDLAPGLVRAPSVGQGVFLLNPADGTIIKRVVLADGNAVTNNSSKKYSVPSDVTVVDADGDGCFDRLYVGDTGANLFRVDIGDSNEANWQSYKLAALGDVENDGGANDRKFLYAPDVVLSVDSSGNQVAYVMIGSGNRESPLSTLIQDKFFMVKDTLGTSPTTIKLGDSGFSEVTVFDPTDPARIDPFAAGFKGWYIDLKEYLAESGIDASIDPYHGEKVVNAPLSVGGVVFFGTNRPMTTKEIREQFVCTPGLGVGRGYAVNYLDGTAAYNRDPENGPGYARSDLYATFTGGGLAPSPVSGLVQIGDSLRRFLIGGGGTGATGSSIEGQKLQVYPSSRRTRTFFYFRKDD